MKSMPFLYLDLDGTIRYSKGGHKFIQGPNEEDRLCAERAGIAFEWANDFFGRKR